MEFWFHCNSCLKRPENAAAACTYQLTCCGHILCSKCFGDTATAKVCKICHRRGITTHAIDKTLPPDVQKFFLSTGRLQPLKMLIEHAQKRIEGAVTFQQNQKVLMEHRLVRKIIQLWNQIRLAKQDPEEKKRLEEEIQYLRNSVRCLREELQCTQARHQEFEKAALQWGFKALSVEGNSRSFPEAQGTVQIQEPSRVHRAMEDKKTVMLAESDNEHVDVTDTTTATNDSSASSQTSDEPLDLSLKGKTRLMNMNSVTTSFENSNVDACDTQLCTGIVCTNIPKEKEQVEKRTQGSIAQKKSIWAAVSAPGRRKWNHHGKRNGHITLSKAGYWKIAAGVAYPVYLPRHVHKYAAVTAKTGSNRGTGADQNRICANQMAALK